MIFRSFLQTLFEITLLKVYEYKYPAANIAVKNNTCQDQRITLNLGLLHFLAFYVIVFVTYIHMYIKVGKHFCQDLYFIIGYK